MIVTNIIEVYFRQKKTEEESEGEELFWLYPQQEIRLHGKRGNGAPNLLPSLGRDCLRGLCT